MASCRKNLFLFPSDPIIYIKFKSWHLRPEILNQYMRSLGFRVFASEYLSDRILCLYSGRYSIIYVPMNILDEAVETSVRSEFHKISTSL
ncbi:hypothetical protein TNCT_247411 [Trichonephila clavata]|uniref:Uncharacterized protein n=1 Tax=Trichonephila clavata TaxID=2740835 RepID=A0A8X6LI34_TRICU|nr:hypothetical protein TNCT_247411 [Trichonephila clavata]